MPVTPKPNAPGTWNSTIVDVHRRTQPPGRPAPVCRYDRNYPSLLNTFEPFRQQGRDFALISRDYTRTAVLDLTTGQVVAEESDQYDDECRQEPRAGFCPAGFYVPDWWDLHDGSVIPGSESWNVADEWPVGDFGFVWGCIWGDDSSWKVQYLDLSRIAQGTLVRDDRFGYVELATAGYSSPCVRSSLPEPGPSPPPSFIRVERTKQGSSVTFAVEVVFDLAGGSARGLGPAAW